MAYTDTDIAEEKRLDRYRNWDGEKSEDELAAAAEEERLAIMQALADILVQKRKEAIEGRKATGIEDDWEEDEQFYQSIDAANPEGETNAGKPTSHEGGAIGITTQQKAGRSSVFVPMTRPYVDAAAARIGDMLLPNDDMPWSLSATPIPDVPPQAQSAIAQAAGAQPPMGAMTGPAAPAPIGMGGIQGMSGPMQAPAGAMPSPMNPAQAIMGQPASVASATEQSAEEKAAEAATKQITDWLIECQYHAEFRKMLENAAKLGTGVLKGPIPDVRVSRKVERAADGSIVLTQVEKTVPISLSVDPRNFYPDPACGEDVQRGGYTWEYDTISARKVEDLKRDPSYILSQLEKVLKEGPCKIGESPSGRPESAKHSMVGSSFGIWYFHGMVDKDTLIAAGVPKGDFEGMDSESMSAVITVINDSVVKAALSPLDSGGFPYDVMPWQRRAGMIWGMGVARQMRTAQRMVNAATRAMMDNGGFTSGPQWAYRDGWIVPIDGSPTITPRKGWRMTKEAPENAKLSDALMFHNIQANQKELEAIIHMGQKMAEDATGLPMLMQGQQGAAPDTVGGMTILNNNGSTVLRRIARQADDCVTERHIRRYYYWLMEVSEANEAKGDFQIDARGSTALVDRELSNQALVNLAPMLEADPDIHKQRFHQELLKAHRIDPKQLYMTDAEKKERDQKPMPPPLPVMVAQIKEEGANQRHRESLQLQAAEGQEERKLDEAKLQADYETALGELSLRHGVSRDQIKAMLAKTAMGLNTQIMLSDSAGQRDLVKHVTPQAITPPTEPAGTAAPGAAFQA